MKLASRIVTGALDPVWEQAVRSIRGSLRSCSSGASRRPGSNLIPSSSSG